MKETEIHVAIPSFNNVEGLRKLIPALQQQSFTTITVLDDASTDETKEYCAQNTSIKYVRSEKNLGTVGANNLILKAMPSSGYLLCIDSDMEVVSEDIPGVMRNFFDKHPRVGAGVGRVVSQYGDTLRWNYNYDINPWRAVFAFATYHAAVVSKNIPLLGNMFRRLSLPFTTHLSSNENKKIDWGIESFFFVRTDLWVKLGGFDSRFKRFHEGPDLFLQIRKMGFQTWFISDIVLKDTDQNTASTWFRRYHWWRSALIYFYKNPSRLFFYYWPRP